MAVFTNMAWPDDPYGTGLLWRKEPRLMAGLGMCWVGGRGREPRPLSYAMAYLRLSRARAAEVSAGARFGFRAIVAVGDEEVGELVRVLDLDVLRARRLATVVSGFLLARDLSRLTLLADGDAARGIRGLMDACESSAIADPGLAQVIDLARDDVEADTELAVVAAQTEIDPWTAGYGFAGARAVGAVVPAARRAGRRQVEWLGAYSVERALVCALAAGRTLGLVTWDSQLDVAQMMAANAWDCFGTLDYGRAGARSVAGRGR